MMMYFVNRLASGSPEALFGQCRGSMSEYDDKKQAVSYAVVAQHDHEVRSKVTKTCRKPGDLSLDILVLRIPV